MAALAGAFFNSQELRTGSLIVNGRSTNLQNHLGISATQQANITNSLNTEAELLPLEGYDNAFLNTRTSQLQFQNAEGNTIFAPVTARRAFWNNGVPVNLHQDADVGNPAFFVQAGLGLNTDLVGNYNSSNNAVTPDTGQTSFSNIGANQKIGLYLTDKPRYGQVGEIHSLNLGLYQKQELDISLAELSQRQLIEGKLNTSVNAVNTRNSIKNDQRLAGIEKRAELADTLSGRNDTQNLSGGGSARGISAASSKDLTLVTNRDDEELFCHLRSTRQFRS